MSLSKFYGFACSIFMLGSVSAAQAEQPVATSPTVDRALAAELAGDAEQRAKLLREATAAEPKDNAARWHLGEVLHEGEWLAVQQVIDRALTDDDLAEYARQRARRSSSVTGQAALARWCDKNDLPAQARAHWIQVLRLDPDHRVAQKELGVVRHEGELMTLAERDRSVAESARVAAKQERLAGRFEKVATNLLSDNLDRIGAAREQIDQLRQPEEVAALVAAVGPAAAETDQAEEIYNMLIEFVALVHEPWAVDILAHEAIASEFETVRNAATDALKYRPEVDVAPLLLSRLKMPLEMTTSIDKGDGDIGYRSEYYREGPTGPEYQYSYNDRARPTTPRYAYMPVTTTEQVTVPTGCGGGLTTVDRTQVVGFMYAGERPDYLYAQNQIYRQAVYKKSQRSMAVKQENESAYRSNVEIRRVLKETTGEDLGESPRDWWTWWQEKLANDPELRDADQLSVSLGLIESQPHGFATGTPVWTRLGVRPIEQILVGDEVLAQDPATGELAFKPVLASEKAGLQRLNLNRSSKNQVDTIVVKQLETGSLSKVVALGLAPGQRAWTAGKGWQAAEDLGAGARLHGHDGAEEVRSISETETEALHYLIVDEFHTLLVGKESILAHDATPPVRQTLDLPGWSAEGGERLAGR